MEENEYEEYKENYFKNSNIFCADFRRFVLSGSFVLDDQKFTDEHSGSAGQGRTAVISVRLSYLLTRSFKRR